nr:immunoglobulin heavy chain junction region [Mus musculus]
CARWGYGYDDYFDVW